jgi:hypothetical protein
MDCRCRFKAFGVTLVHFKEDKMNWGVIFTKKIIFFSNGKPPEIAGKTRILIPAISLPALQTILGDLQCSVG